MPRPTRASSSPSAPADAAAASSARTTLLAAALIQSSLWTFTFPVVRPIHTRCCMEFWLRCGELREEEPKSSSAVDDGCGSCDFTDLNGLLYPPDVLRRV